MQMTSKYEKPVSQKAVENMYCFSSKELTRI